MRTSKGVSWGRSHPSSLESQSVAWHVRKCSTLRRRLSRGLGTGHSGATPGLAMAFEVEVRLIPVAIRRDNKTALDLFGVQSEIREVEDFSPTVVATF